MTTIVKFYATFKISTLYEFDLNFYINNIEISFDITMIIGNIKYNQNFKHPFLNKISKIIYNLM